MKTVLITGASGFLGHHLVNSFIQRGDTKVIAVLGLPKDKINSFPKDEKLVVYSSIELFSIDFGHVDTLIHTAFSRGDDLSGLTRSIEFTERVIELVNNQDIDSMINISSQGVYKGVKPGEKVDENGVVEPNTAYGLAKWAVENMLKIGCQKKYTSIRMASLSSNARFLTFFVDCVISGRSIVVTAPNQYASMLDFTDAVSGILSIESLPIVNRAEIINLGSGKQYSILDYAHFVNSIGTEYGYSPVPVVVKDSGSTFAICMDISRIKTDLGWEANVTIDGIIRRLFSKQV